MKSKVWEFLTLIEADPQKRGYLFEKVYAKKYLENEPIFRKIYKEVKLWTDWKDRPFKKDIGIDLVCFGFDGKITAVQAKAYDPQHTISKPDIDSFISASSHPLFSKRLLIGTTNKINKHAKDIIQAQKDKPCQSHLLNEIERSNFLKIIKSRKKAINLLKPLKARKYQEEVLLKSKEHFKNEDRGKLIMACGTGKTFTSFLVADEIKAKKTVFLAPSIHLVSQSLEVWVRNSKNEKKDFLVVCSDKTAGEIEESISDYDFPSTTNPKEISDFMNTKKEYVIFGTYDSSYIIFNQAKKNKTTFDFVICDEAHSLAGYVNENYGSALKNNSVIKKRMFMTATEKIMSVGIQKAAKARDVDLLSMDDEKIYGKTIHELTFGEAIDKKLLADYKIVLTGVDNRIKVNNSYIKVINKTIDLETFAKAFSLKKTMKKYNLSSAITFHNYVKSARLFSDLLSSMNIISDYVSGKNTSRERKEIVNQLEENNKKPTVISNARVFSEGVDIPDLDAIAFIDPKTTIIGVVQAVGRAIRNQNNPEKIGYIIIPLYLDGNNTNFESLYKTLIAMRSHDVQLAEEIDQLAIKLGSKTNLSKSKISKLYIDIPNYIDDEFKLNIYSELIKATSESWYFYLGLLKLFYKKYGHTKVKTNHFEDGYPLGKWIGHQRGKFKNNEISEEKINLILETDPNFIWDVSQAKFDYEYELIAAFMKKKNRKPKHGEIYEGEDLGVMAQYWQTRFNTKVLKDEAIINKFNDLKRYGWYWKKMDEHWNKNIYNFIKFAEREKHSYPDIKAIEGGAKIGRFASDIRSSFPGTKKPRLAKPVKRVVLNNERIKDLNQNVPYWDPRQEKIKDFENNIYSLEEFLNNYSYLQLRRSTLVDDFHLGTFGSKIFLGHNDIAKLYLKEIKLIKDKYGIKPYGLNRNLSYKTYGGVDEFIKKVDNFLNKADSNNIEKEDINWLNNLNENMKNTHKKNHYEYYLMKKLKHVIKK